MNIRFYILIFVLLLNSMLFGQETKQTNRIIIKFKKEITDKTFRGNNLTGSSKIDSINKTFHNVEVKKQSLGKNSNRSVYIISFQQM